MFRDFFLNKRDNTVKMPSGWGTSHNTGKFTSDEWTYPVLSSSAVDGANHGTAEHNWIKTCQRGRS